MYKNECKNGRSTGFTLIEILLVLALAGATLSLSLHTFQQWSERRLLAEPLTALVKTLRFARAAAIGGGHAVTVCPSKDGAACADAGYEGGWIVFADTSGYGVRDSGERILASRAAFDSRVSLRSNTFASHVTFAADGRIATGGGFTPGSGRFVVCADRDPAAAVGVFITRSGRLRVAAPGEIQECLTS